MDRFQDSTPVADVHFNRMVIFGLGMIGGSVARSVRGRGMIGEIVAVDRCRENLDMAIKSGVIDGSEQDPVKAIEQADLVLLAAPVDAIIDLLGEIAPAVGDGLIITDVGSVKEKIVAAAGSALGRHFPYFVPGHPVAGKERSGFAAASEELFLRHKVVLTPDPHTDSGALETVSAMWQAMGAEVQYMSCRDHDRILSITSHLPHVLAYAMMNYLTSADDPDQCYEMAAGGFYDFTRIASSDPVMWRDIVIMNRDRLLSDIRQYQDALDRIADMIARDSRQDIEACFAAARAARSLVTEKRRFPAK